MSMKGHFRYTVNEMSSFMSPDMPECYIHLANASVQGNIQVKIQEQGQSALTFCVKGLAEEANTEITLPTKGFDSTTFWSLAQIPNLQSRSL